MTRPLTAAVLAAVILLEPVHFTVQRGRFRGAPAEAERTSRAR